MKKNDNNKNKNIQTFKKYIHSLKNTKKKCHCKGKNESIKIHSKAQSIELCKNTVIKGPLKKTNSIIEKINNETMKIDSMTMNLLIQSITKKYIQHKMLKEYNIEHYNDLCYNKNIKLISKRATFQYPTLEDYILKSPDKMDTKIKVIINSFKSIFKVMDKLHDDIQFHHCDPKCAQLLLFKTKNKNQKYPQCMLGDLDKVILTLKINNKPYHIRLSRDNEKNTLKVKFLKVLDTFKLLNKITSLRFLSYSKKSNLFDKIVFISSACNLLNNLEHAEKLSHFMLNEISKKYNIKLNHEQCNDIINLNKYYSKTFFKKNNKTFRAGVGNVQLKYLKKYFPKELFDIQTNLKSIININSKNQIIFQK
jgi:hypothetical protein